jgi:hypothetical protein
MIKWWLLVATACDNCGGRQAVSLLDHPPTDEDRTKVHQAAGGMFCISTKQFEIVPGEPTHQEVE